MTAPAISVVVFPFSGRAALARCLDSLCTQTGVDAVEVVVPFPHAYTGIGEFAARYPTLRFLPDSGRTPAELRSRGIAAARAGIVALIEDHCIPGNDWCSRILDAHAGSCAAVGGAVEKGFLPGRTDDTALNWAVYMADYTRYMNPLPAGPVAEVSDTNSSYKKDELAQIRAVWQVEFHENVVNQVLRERGRLLWFAPDVVVFEQRNLTLRAALRDRYTFGRLFASTRVEKSSSARRSFLVAASVVMPPLLIMRIARTLLQRRKHGAQFVRSFPYLLLVTSAWMAGEMIGYLTARPEASLAAGSAGDPSRMEG